jgi:hypothetical protein
MEVWRKSGHDRQRPRILAPALGRFSPTPEFPKIDQAQTLLAALLS